MERTQAATGESPDEDGVVARVDRVQFSGVTDNAVDSLSLHAHSRCAPVRKKSEINALFVWGDLSDYCVQTFNRVRTWFRTEHFVLMAWIWAPAHIGQG
jgi:hypothetical protein